MIIPDSVTYNGVTYPSLGSVAVLTAPSCQDTAAVIEATPAVGNLFVRWNDGNTDNPRTLVVTADTHLVASFALSVHDTTTVYLRDTLITNTYIYDTSIYSTFRFDTTMVFDTVIINIYTCDTTISNHYQYDTVIVNNFVYDTVIVNNYYYDTIIITNTYHDTVIVNNYVYDTIYFNRYIFDTIYIHDTVFVDPMGIENIETINAKIYQRNGQVVVEGAEDNTVTMYDVNGRVLATKQDNDMLLRFDAPVSGTYLIKIGNYPARRVVVIR